MDRLVAEGRLGLPFFVTEKGEQKDRSCYCMEKQL